MKNSLGSETVMNQSDLASLFSSRSGLATTSSDSELDDLVAMPSETVEGTSSKWLKYHCTYFSS